MANEELRAVAAVFADVADLAARSLPPGVPRTGATAGEPHEASLEVFARDGASVGIWECTPGRFPSEKVGIGEFMRVLSGRATVRDEAGSVHRLEAGSILVAPDGWRGEWEIHETVRKVYVVWPTS